MEAEYDYDNNRVVGLKFDNGQTRGTNNPRVLGARTEWLPVITEWPDGYTEQFQTLLHENSVQYVYDPVGNRVTINYPDADFSPSAIRDTLQFQIDSMAARSLSNTDWYVIRKYELGTPIPDNVVAYRAEIRAKQQAFHDLLPTVADSDLLDFNIAYDTSVPAPHPVPDPGKPVAAGDGSQWVTDATGPHEEGHPVRPAAPDERHPNGPQHDPEVTE